MLQQYSGQTLLYLAALKIPLAAADIVSTYYVYKILVRFLTSRRALTFSAFFAFNPLVVFESSGGGFNDPIAIAFTVASVFHLLQYRDRQGSDKQDLSRSGLFLGLGIATKIYPILLIPVLIREVKGVGSRLIFLLFALLPAIIFSAPFLTWDPLSYIELVSFRNVGGQHPLFPSLSQGVLGWFVLIILGGLLLMVYVRKSSLTARIALTFLWVNLAIFSFTFNYMIWGIPFFTVYAAEYRKHLLMPMSPLLTLFASFIFEGSYDALRGSAGLYYWTFHIFRQSIVPTLVSPWIGTIGFLTLTISEAVAAYYFISLAFRGGLSKRYDPTKWLIRLGIETKGKALFQTPRNKALTCMVLVTLVASSWTLVSAQASFLSHQYPTVKDSSFLFTDNFHSSFIDYQWVFPGRGSYSVNSSQGIVGLGTPQNGTGELFRGWGSLVDGFHASTAAVAGFMFRFTGFSSGSVGMIIANMTDGQLAVLNQATVNLVYMDQQNNRTIPLGTGDNNWHNFTIEYAGGQRILMIDGSSWTLPGGTFSRLILGNGGYRTDYGGTAEFSRVIVEINDFPAGYQSSWASALALIVPLLMVLLLYAATEKIGLKSKGERLPPPRT